MERKTFNDLGLIEPILKALNEEGYTHPTPIQEQAIPHLIQGRDLLGCAQTGTGKTAAFAIPILQELTAKAPQAKRAIRTLILTPTRELAIQIGESFAAYGRNLQVKHTVIFGGVGQKPQTDALHRGVDIVVATPGRLLDLMGQGFVHLNGLEIFVLDEADRMLDMGFINDIKKVLALVPKQKQTLLFSATFSDEIRALAHGLLRTPKLIEVARRNSTVELIDQRIYRVDKGRKRELLTKLISDGQWHQVLVFTRTKHGANALSEKLNADGITSAAIHGNKSQGARTRALADFKSLKLNVLVATDIAARGLDIDQLPHVVNFELPNVAEDYVHRIGRTGRAGSSGEAVSLVCVDELDLLRDIERLQKLEIKVTVLPGFEPDPKIRAEPIINGRSGQSRGQRPQGGQRSGNRGGASQGPKPRSGKPPATRGNAGSQRSGARGR